MRVLLTSLSQSVSLVCLFVCIHGCLSLFIRVFYVYSMDVSRYVTTQKRMLISACGGMSCTQVDGVAARRCVCTQALDPLSAPLLVPLPGCQIHILIETQHGADVYGLVALASKHPSVYFCSIVAVQECIHEFVQFFFVCVTRDGRTEPTRG